MKRIISKKYAEEIQENPAVQRMLKGRWNQMQSRIAYDRGDRWTAMQHAWTALKQQPTVYRGILLVLPLFGSLRIDHARTLRRQLVDAQMRATTDQFWT